MKKKIIVCMSLMIVILSGFVTYLAFDNTKNVEEGEELFVIMVETEDKYIETDLVEFPGEEYIYNDILSNCTNGSVMTWDEENRSITMNISGSEKCYVYFDLK